MMCKLGGKRKPMEKTHLKYVDDFSILEAVDRKSLEVDENLPCPLNYHSRTEQVLPEENSKVALAIQDIMQYSNNHEMKINHEKSKLMLFNTLHNHDFMPTISIDGEQLEVV